MIKAGVLGSPISHSLSPILHRAVYAELGLAASYEAIEVRAGGLKNFLDSLDNSWTGFSLTMPLKEEVLKLASVINPIAQKIRSANTLYKGADGWSATSTDITGFKEALAANSITKMGSVLVIGAGATARAVVGACDLITEEITVMSRNPARISEMSNCATKAKLDFITWGQTPLISQVDLVVNTTPKLVADSLAGQLSAKPHGTLFEVLYEPWPTALLARWRTLGSNSIDGLELLIHQGIDQIEIFTGKSLDRASISTLMRKAAMKVLA